MKKIKLLIVDDEKDYLVLTELNLKNTGKYEVRTLSESKDTIFQAREFMPDVILLDLVMPELHGFDACYLLKQDPVTAKIPVIIVSALHKDSDKRKAFELGAAEFLYKPVPLDEFILKINQVMGLK
ncbi:MAG: response regulator [Candidatus Omnitrophica bacterium]|nr:response regulator [Candidatus Omnitrophota bacterium]